MSTLAPSIAIIGSGPSGCYAAQFLRKKWPLSEIVIFEALPVPYGLLRYGVATDHQGTKAIAAQFDRLFLRENIQFAGNVYVGKDVSIDEITESFDIVVRATGLRHDRKLEIDGAESCEIIGAGEILKALNGYPNPLLPTNANGELKSLGQDIALIGMGNVSMDVIRLLCKSHQQLEGSDINDTRLNQLRSSGIKNIHVFSRSTATEAKFDLSMLKEVMALEHVQLIVEDLDTNAGSKQAEHLISSVEKEAAKDADIQVTFHFQAKPVAIENLDGKVRLDVERSDRTWSSSFVVDNVIAAIGFSNSEEFIQDECHWNKPNVFKVGWLNKNGKGAIAENRKDAKSVADDIIRYMENTNQQNYAAGFKLLEQQLNGIAISFADWLKINEYECSTAVNGRCRSKLTDIEKMLEIAKTMQLIDKKIA
ncbi:oxidoreductase [Acinetobacter tandoii]|nr:oxidoreductase [Acinetobacter tandoii]